MTARTKSILKYAFALVLLVLILRNAQLEKIGGYLKQISLLQLVMAFALLTLAQVASALRMRLFFRGAGFALNIHFSIFLYYVGAFYNFLLPGGIGGDAYKVILVRKRMEIHAMQGIRIMLADRASGLCILMFMMFAALGIIHALDTIPHGSQLLVAAGIITLFAYLGFSRWLLKQSPVLMLESLYYSVAVQFLWVATLIVIWDALGTHRNIIAYIGLYCAASIAGMLPVSVGGLGIKEMTYFYGAKQLHAFAGLDIDPSLGVALSLCLFALGFIATLPGLFWLEKVAKAETS